LAVSKLKLGILVNFGEESLKFKRIILWIKKIHISKVFSWN
jgi:hypothetical protein